MTEVGVRALKQNASAVVAAAAAGEEVTITDRGRPVAQLVPLPTSRLEELVAAGRARPAKRRWADLPEPARRRATQTSLGEVLVAQREAERY
ncbi:MAG: type II toxin-antitoxin system prevent-host-death family antitoxin [Actinobacteria bacterium]|nr:type II toxin-antitoxin system prevent-host-death family antitoxin [Actinomycetota bacterium]